MVLSYHGLDLRLICPLLQSLLELILGRYICAVVLVDLFTPQSASELSIAPGGAYQTVRILEKRRHIVGLDNRPSTFSQVDVLGCNARSLSNRP
jgi:hypothetical protein